MRCIFIFSLITISNFSFSQVDYGKICGYTDQYGKDNKLGCGESSTDKGSDGRLVNLYCDCSSGSPTLKVSSIGEGSSTTNTQGPSQAELDAYYNNQWTDQLSIQADLDFKKGVEAFKEGKCEKAVRHFNMARKMVSLKIYEDSYQAAVACVNKNSVAQAPVIKPEPVINNKPTVPVTTNTPDPRGRETRPTTIVVKDSVKLAIASEQKSMEANPQTWVEYQKEQFKKKIEEPNYWCKNYVDELQQQIDLAKANEPWNPMKPKTVSDLKPGDVILIEGTAVAMVDDMFTGSMKSTAAHTLTYLKEAAGGVKLFLDNQPGIGPVIISEAQLREKYSGRGTEIARMTGSSLSDVEVKRLWDKAIEFQQKNNQKALFSYNLSGEKKYLGGTNYGVWGDDNMVCSEASWALVMATKREGFNPEAKGWVNGWLKKNTIGFSPADFYENNQYFLISTLKL